MVFISLETIREEAIIGTFCFKGESDYGDEFLLKKHFPESKNTSKNSKTLLRMKKHSLKSKNTPILILESVFVFRGVLLDSGLC